MESKELILSKWMDGWITTMIFNTNLHNYWDIYYISIFSLAQKNILIPREWFLFVDLRALSLFDFFKYIMANQNQLISMADLSFIPLTVEDMIVIVYLWREHNQSIKQVQQQNNVNVNLNLSIQGREFIYYGE